MPQVDLSRGRAVFEALFGAIQKGLVRSCHDLSEGGLAAAVAEMAFAGDIGADLTQLHLNSTQESDEVSLFSESTSRFLVEARPLDAKALQDCFGDKIPVTRIGRTCKEPRLRIAGANGEWIVWANLADLKEAWQKPLRW